jgi:hypothetical protein
MVVVSADAKGEVTVAKGRGVLKACNQTRVKVGATMKLPNMGFADFVI